MSDSDTLLKNRLTELAKRAETRGVWTFSEFLSLAEQDVLMRLRLGCPYTLDGGWVSAERRVAAFGSEDICGWTEAAPIVCVKIAPVQPKFADRLTHRDFLGSLMGLGIRREVLGDIAVIDNCGWLFCLEGISQYIIDNLTGVKRTTVACTLSEPPEKLVEPPPVSQLVVASERLDAVIAAVYRLSRSQSQELIAGGKVFLSGRLCQNSDEQIDDGTVVSVRGTGRFLYEGVERETKKGRLRVNVRIY